MLLFDAEFVAQVSQANYVTYEIWGSHNGDDADSNILDVT